MASAKTSKKSKTVGLVSSELEKLEGTKIKLTMTVSAERLREGLHHVYSHNKQYFNIPGFRKGKAPRKMIEQLYGRDIFHDDAMNYILPNVYEEALDKHELEPVYKPNIDAEDMKICETEGAVIIATIHTRPTAEVSEYAGLPYPKGDAEATEEDIDNALKGEQEKNARMLSVERPAEMGDIVTINFKGFLEGEEKPFDGGIGEDHDLTLGSGQFIPGFEDQVVGHVPGDDIKVNVTFPGDYHAADFAGKSAIFEVEVLDVKSSELPEINDDFAEDVSEFDTLEEWREDLAKKIKEHKEANLEHNKRNHIMKKLIANSTAEIPEEMYLGRLDDLFRDFAHSIQARGMDIENYMRFTGTNEQFLKASWRKQAEDDVQGMLALEAVALKESITVPEEDFEKRVKDATNKEGDELAKIIEDMHPMRRKELTRSLLCEKALDLIMEKAVMSEDEAFEDPIPLEDEEEEQGDFLT